AFQVTSHKREATGKVARLSTKPVQTLDSVLGSLGARFDEEACTLFGNNISVVMNQVHAVPEADQRNHLETCRQLFEVGHESWLEALVELVHRYAEKLAQIAVCYPALVSNDPAKWITLQLKLLLTKHLRQELCLEILSQQAR